MKIKTIQCDVNVKAIEEFLYKHELINKGVTITFVNGNKKKLFCEDKLGHKYTGEFDFRGVCFPADKLIYIFVDQFETEESLIWLTVHELTHISIYEQKLLKRYFDNLKVSKLNKIGVDYNDYSNNPTVACSDDIHEVIPEEEFCNNVATEFVGFDFSRKWWREKQNEKEKIQNEQIWY